MNNWSQSPRGRGRYSTRQNSCPSNQWHRLNPLAVGVGIQPMSSVPVKRRPKSQSPRGRGRDSTMRCRC